MLIVAPPPSPPSETTVADQTVVELGYEVTRFTLAGLPAVVVTWAPPPSSTLPAGHVAVPVIVTPFPGFAPEVTVVPTIL
jgi:hypothetical protein